MPVISVIVPVYKVEPYLHRCLDSILNQTFTDFELILVDDGSPDDCGAICDEYAKKDNRVTVIHQENGGLSAARNAGIDWSFANSDSQWLTFIDSDDWVHPQYLEILYNAVRDNGAKVSCCAFESVKEEKSFENITVPNIEIVDTKKFYMNNNLNFVTSCMKLYYKESFKSIRFPVGKINEDQFTTYKVLFDTENIVFINEYLYYYFLSPNSIMRSKFNIKRYDDIEALEEQVEYFKERNWKELEIHAKKHINSHKAWFIVMSKQDGVYSQVPNKYRINKFKLLKIMYNELGRDKYEYLMSRYYPYTVKFQSYYFKIKSIFTKTHNS